jgi:CTP:molybdopterin cytidylyltransferase MocA
VLPSPNTVAVARLYRSQRVHEAALSASSCQVVTTHDYPAGHLSRLRAGVRNVAIPASGALFFNCAC